MAHLRSDFLWRCISNEFLSCTKLIIQMLTKWLAVSPLVFVEWYTNIIRKETLQMTWYVLHHAHFMIPLATHFILSSIWQTFVGRMVFLFLNSINRAMNLVLVTYCLATCTWVITRSSLMEVRKYPIHRIDSECSTDFILISQGRLAYHAEMKEQNSGENWSAGATGGAWSTIIWRSP